MFANQDLPEQLRPADGRFGAGPSLIRRPQIDVLASSSIWGTSHRQPPVINLVKSIQEGLTQLFSLPEGYEIVLGNGGATAFWAMASISLIRSRAHFASFGEFGSKFAADAASSPWIETSVVEGAPGTLSRLEPVAGVDTYAYPHNETSTGVCSDIYRVEGEDVLTLVDATSVAGAAEVDLTATDAYYFSPQKAFGSEGGLWVAILSPAAIARGAELNSRDDRPQFGFLNLTSAVAASRKGQTVNTPAIGTLLLLDEQIRWMLQLGGLAAVAQKSLRGATLVREWAQSRDFTELFVTEPQWRSPVITTVDLDPSIPVAELCAALRRAGIVDVEGYRGLGRNQLRIASFPSVDEDDIAALLASIDYLV